LSASTYVLYMWLRAMRNIAPSAMSTCNEIKETQGPVIPQSRLPRRRPKQTPLGC